MSILAFPSALLSLSLRLNMNLFFAVLTSGAEMVLLEKLKNSTFFGHFIGFTHSHKEKHNDTDVKEHPCADQAIMLLILYYKL